MKITITLLITIFMAINGFAQTIDWAKAPRNPVPFAYTANHFGYNGNVALASDGYTVRQFSKDGLLEREYQAKNLTEYVYDENKNLTGLYVYKDYGEQVSLTLVKFHYKDGKLIGTQSSHNSGDEHKQLFQYNSKGLLSVITKHQGDTIKSFEYDEAGRLIVMKDRSWGSLNMAFDFRYAYQQQKDMLKISLTSKNIKEPNKPADTYIYYYNKQGLESETPDFKKIKTDAKGNILNDRFSYLYFDGQKTGAEFPQGTPMSNFQLTDAKKLYAGKDIQDSNCQGNCKDGWGSFTYQNGDKYEGFWKDSKMNGYGLFTFTQAKATYDGAFLDNTITGMGILHYDDGNKTYHGEFQSGVFSGFGASLDKKANTSKLGLFKDNKLQTEAKPTGNTTGCVNGNCQNGIGEYHFENGDRFMGHFTNSQPFKGIFYYNQKGAFHIGEFKNKQAENFGMLVHKDGAFSMRGYWKNGKLNGFGKSYNRRNGNNAVLEIGEFKDGKLIRKMD